jgi:hypothetical protein
MFCQNQSIHATKVYQNFDSFCMKMKIHYIMFNKKISFIQTKCVYINRRIYKYIKLFLIISRFEHKDYLKMYLYFILCLNKHQRLFWYVLLFVFVIFNFWKFLWIFSLCCTCGYSNIDGGVRIRYFSMHFSSHMYERKVFVLKPSNSELELKLDF